MLRTVNAVHRAVFRATNGLVAGKLLGMPVVDLRTKGRRSGLDRWSMLTSPVQDGDTIVLVASRGGDPHHPAWFLNLKADPDVEVVMRGGRRSMRARVATADEKKELWPRVVKANRGYGQYQERTTREIPLVILEPADRRSPDGR